MCNRRDEIIDVELPLVKPADRPTDTVTDVTPSNRALTFHSDARACAASSAKNGREDLVEYSRGP
jgi:hypothetical protein